MIAVELPPVGYTIREAEQILGMSEKYLYRLIRQGKVSAYLDSVNQLRISREEVYALMREKEARDMN
jgi:excisionase family DNA binding protein